jgi:predicted glycosyltransferase
MMRDPEFQKYSKYVPVGKDFRNELMKLLHNAEESNEEKISILRDILDKLESGEE